MKPFFKKILLFLADFAALTASCFVAYYISVLVGLNPSNLFVDSWYLFVVIKAAVYLLFSMYTFDQYRMRAIDIIGCGVANLVADIVMILLFSLDVGENVVPIAISIVWDMALCVALRILFEKLLGYEEYEYEDDEEDENEDNKSEDDFPDSEFMIDDSDSATFFGEDEIANEATLSDVNPIEDDISELLSSEYTNDDMFLSDDTNDFISEADSTEHPFDDILKIANEEGDIEDFDMSAFAEDEVDDIDSDFDLNFDELDALSSMAESEPDSTPIEELTKEADGDLDVLDMIVNIDEGDLPDLFADSDDTAFDSLGELMNVSSIDLSEDNDDNNEESLNDSEVFETLQAEDDETKLHKSDFASSDDIAMEIESITDDYLSEEVLFTNEKIMNDDIDDDDLSVPENDEAEYDSLALRNMQSIAEMERIVEDASPIEEVMDTIDNSAPVLMEVSESTIGENANYRKTANEEDDISANAEYIPDNVEKNIGAELNLKGETQNESRHNEPIQSQTLAMDNKIENDLQTNSDMTLAKIKKQEIIDSLVSDIKNMYMNLSDKNKFLEDRERELFVKYVQLDQREKEIQVHKDRLSNLNSDNKRRNAHIIDDGDVFGPSDNLDLVMQINNLLEEKSKTPRETKTAFVNITPVSDMADDEVHEELERLKSAEAERIKNEKAQEELEMRKELERLREAFRLEKEKEEEIRLQKELEEKQELERLRKAEEERQLAEKRKKDEEKRAEYERLMKAQEELERIRQANEDRLELEQLRKAEEERLAKEEAIRLAKTETEQKLREELEEKAKLEAQMRIQEETERLEKEKEALLAQQEAERLLKEEEIRRAKEETEKKLREELEQKAKEEAELRIKEETERLEKEREKLLAQQEKERAELLAQQEEERLAHEEELRKAKEETERKLREEMEKKAQEEAKLRARQEAERQALERSKLIAKEEAEKKAREEAIRLAKEETERLLREELEQKAKEETERLSREKQELIAQQEKERAEYEKAVRAAKEETEKKLQEELKRKDEEAALLRAKAEEKQKKLDEEKLSLELQLEAERVKLEEEKKKQLEAKRLLLEKERENEQKRLEAKRKAYEMNMEIEKLRAKESQVAQEEEQKALKEAEAEDEQKSQSSALFDEENMPLLSAMLDDFPNNDNDEFDFDDISNEILDDIKSDDSYEGKSLLDSL